MILGYDNKTNWTMWEMQQFRNMKNCDGSEVSFCYATKSYFVISILSRDWFLSDTSNLGTLSPFTNAFFFWILTARGYARGRGYAPSITSDRTSGWHATFGEESGKSVARWSSLWVDICVARCVKQCQIRRNQSKRSLIDYLTMLSGSKAAFRTNFLQERSAKNGNLLNYGTLFFLLDSGTSLTCIKKIRLNLFLFQSKEKLAQLWRALLCTWLIHTKIGKEPLQPPTQSPEKLVSVPSFEVSLLCWYVSFCSSLSPLLVCFLLQKFVSFASTLLLWILGFFRSSIELTAESRKISRGRHCKLPVSVVLYLYRQNTD